jgi:hypothetical protein
MNTAMKLDAPVDISRLRDRLTKAHVKLITHPETQLYAGVFLMGKSEIVEGVPTAYTDGINKVYGAEFCAYLTKDSQLRYVVMHENGHIALRHLPRHRDFWEEDAQCANMAADYVINGLIEEFKDKTLCEQPPAPFTPLYDPMFKNWSFGEVYRYLRKEKQDEQQGKQDGDGKGDGKFSQRGGALDEHDLSKIKDMTPEQQKEVMDRVAQALEQGGMLAGMFGKPVPRTVSDALTPKVNWASELRDFVNNMTQGRDDDLSLRRFDRRWSSLDIIMPGSIAETVGEIVWMSDTSGSIDDKQNAEAMSEFCSLVKTIQPERVRMIWWDHMVHAEQVFTPDEYDNIASALKPVGGGGTRVSSCSEYYHKQGLKADCVVVFTDGYVEKNIDWQNMPPTLWVVTQNKEFDAPTGRIVQYYND